MSKSTRNLARLARTVDSMRRESDRAISKGRDIQRREPRRTGTRAAVVAYAIREA